MNPENVRAERDPSCSFSMMNGTEGEVEEAGSIFLSRMELLWIGKQALCADVRKKRDLLI